MFSDVSVHRSFIIDRISGSQKTMRRMLVTTKDGAMYMCKPSGLVRRILHVGQLTHLAHAPDEQGSPAAWVLLRVTKEHDMLFQHVPPPGSAVRHTIGEAFLDFIISQRAKTSGAPLLVTSRPTAQMLHEAATLTKPPNFVKPRAATPGGPDAPVFVPTTMDDCKILVPAAEGSNDGSGGGGGGSGGGGGDAPIGRSATITVDAIFMELLKRAMDNHLVAASNPPRIVVRPGEMYEPFQVSQRFFEAFCMAFDRDCPLVVVLQSHLPHVVTFRASQQFWNFVSRFLRVSRPPNGVLSLLSSDHIVAHVDGDEAAAVTATLLEWNDAIIAWELDVRRRNESARPSDGSVGAAAGGAGGGATNSNGSLVGGSGGVSDAHPVIGIGSGTQADGVFWRALLTELSQQSQSQQQQQAVEQLQTKRMQEMAAQQLAQRQAQAAEQTRRREAML